MNYSYRIATLSDLPALRMLWRDFITETEGAYPTNMLGSLDTFTRQLAIAMAQAPASVFAFLCEDGILPLGMLLYEIQFRSIGEPTRYGFIHAAYVHPAHRGHGITAQLAELTAEHMLAQKLLDCELSAHPDNKGWEAYAGFVPYEVRQHVALAQGLARLDKHRARKVRERGNGLDHEAPLSAEQPEGRPAEEKP